VTLPLWPVILASGLWTEFSTMLLSLFLLFYFPRMNIPGMLKYKTHYCLCSNITLVRPTSTSLFQIATLPLAFSIFLLYFDFVNYIQHNALLCITWLFYLLLVVHF
jgi:hypothetical protein